MKSALWLWIAAVACGDVAFAWHHSATLPEWELNPVALHLFAWGGIPALGAYRAGVLSFAVSMSYTDTRFSWLVLPAWLAGHLYLAAVLARCY